MYGGIFINSNIIGLTVGAPPAPLASSYSQVALSLGADLVHANDFDTTWKDETVNGFDGVVTGATWSATGGPGGELAGYMEFDGVNDDVNMGNILNYDGPFSFVFWAEMPADQVGDRANIIAKGNFGRYHLRHSIGGTDNIDRDQTWVFEVRATDAGNAATTSSGAIPTNQWNMYLIRFTGTVIEVWTIDSVGTSTLIATFTSSVTIGSNTQNLLYGAQNDTGANIRRFWKGKLAGVCAFDFSLSVANAEALHATLFPPPPDDILLYPLIADENQDLVLTDSPPFDTLGLFEYCNNGDYARWDNVDLTGIKSFDIRYAAHSSANGGGFTIRLDSPTGTVIGTVFSENTGGWLTFTETLRVTITETSGIHTIYIVFFEKDNVFTGIGAMNFEYLKLTANNPEGSEEPPPDPDPEEEPTHFVTLTGVDDAGRDGTVGQEWRTLAYAFSRLATSPGSIIGWGAGVHTETSYPVPPIGVSVKGGGIGVTEGRLTSGLFATVRDVSHTFQHSKAYFYMNHSNDTDGNQFFSDFTINGQKNNDTGVGVYGGFHISNRRNVTIKRVEIYDTAYSCIFARRLFTNGGLEIHNCNIHDAAHCIQLGSRVDGAYMHDNFLSSNYRPPDMLNNPLGRAMSFLAEDVPNGWYKNIRFSYNDCRSRSDYDLCVEPFIKSTAIGTVMQNIEIDHNYMNGTLSCVANFNDDLSTGAIQWKIHHNVIEALQATSVCLELNVNDAEVYENYFFGGVTHCITCYISPARVKRFWRIHNNIARDFNSASFSQAFVRCLFSDMIDVEIINNTIHNHSGQRITLAWATGQGGTNPDMTDVIAKNNVIYDEGTSTSNGGGIIFRKDGTGTASGLVATYNYMYQMGLGSLPMTQNNNVISTTAAPDIAATPDDRQKTFADVDTPLPAYYTPTVAGNLDGTGESGANKGAL